MNNKFDKLTKDIWVGDSGATGHMANSAQSMYDLVKSKGGITIGDVSGIQITQG